MYIYIYINNSTELSDTIKKMQQKDTQEEDTKFLHNVYKNDPILFVNYVGKEVKIIMKDENIHSGIVYTIDPVSERCVLEKNILF